MSDHHRRLERMFDSGPINQHIYAGTQITVEDRKAVLELSVTENFYHAAGAMHGSAYFKMLDDAAYFAAASIEETYFILTKSFEIQFLRPVEKGVIKAIGKVESIEGKFVTTTSELFNDEGKLVGKGRGIFVPGSKELDTL